MSSVAHSILKTSIQTVVMNTYSIIWDILNEPIIYADMCVYTLHASTHMPIYYIGPTLPFGSARVWRLDHYSSVDSLPSRLLSLVFTALSRGTHLYVIGTHHGSRFLLCFANECIQQETTSSLQRLCVTRLQACYFLAVLWSVERSNEYTLESTTKYSCTGIHLERFRCTDSD